MDEREEGWWLLAWVAAIVAIMFAMAIPARAEPLVVEHYDVVLIEYGDWRGDWQDRNIYFLRQGRVIAERRMVDAMQWSQADGQFLLLWNDCGLCHRRIAFDVLVIREATEKEDEPILEWFNQFRAMTDLKAP